MEARKAAPSPARPPLPVAIYARISRDKTGEGLGVERQETDSRALAERMGWEVVAVYVDNDISAYGGKRRPQYRAMLEAVKRGEIQGIVAWHTDRLHRRAVELEEFVAIAERHNLQIQTVTSGDVNLSTPDGRMIARMLGAAAQREVEHNRERIKASNKQRAAAGKYRGGRRPFGYGRDGTTVDKAEASHLRHATTAVLAGRSLRAVAKDLNERGSTTSTGKPWEYQMLRDVLLRPRNAGLVHTGDARRPDVEIIGPAEWPAIVDEDTWRAVHALLTAPSRRSTTTNDTRWLGSGTIYECGYRDEDGHVCGAGMRAIAVGQTKSRPRYKRQHHYRCREAAHLTIHAEHTDKHVREVVAEMVRDPRIIAAMTPQGDDRLSVDRERRTVLVTRLGQFEDDYARGVITGAQLAKATAAVEEEMAEVEARLVEGVRRSSANPILAAPDPGQAFLDAPIDIQRAVVAAVVRVEVLPATRRGVSWTSDRVNITSALGTR